MARLVPLKQENYRQIRASVRSGKGEWAPIDLRTSETRRRLRDTARREPTCFVVFVGWRANCFSLLGMVDSVRVMLAMTREPAEENR